MVKNINFMDCRGVAVIFVFAVVLVFLQSGCGFIKQNSANNDSNGKSNGATPSISEQKNDTADGKSETPELCRNVFYPVGPNVERKYHMTYQKMKNLDQDYTEKFSNFTPDGFTSNNTYKSVTANVNWRCLPEGLLSVQYANTIEIKEGGGVKIETLDSRGISFPAETRWNPGEKWTTHYDIKETMGDRKAQANGTVDQNGEIIGAEEITVPAGTFQTMKAKINLTLNLQIKVSGLTVPTKTNVETTSWFAKDVGMVKSVSSISNLDSGTIELLSYSGTK